MITKRELMELLRSEEGISEIADNILARLGQQPEGSATPKAPEARSPSTGNKFEDASRRLDVLARRLGVSPRIRGEASPWAIRLSRIGNSYDVLELASKLLDRLDALDAKGSWDMVDED
jgi:hypothetical protein